jgi:hypothetical protein
MICVVALSKAQAEGSVASVLMNEEWKRDSRVQNVIPGYPRYQSQGCTSLDVGKRHGP